MTLKKSLSLISAFLLALVLIIFLIYYYFTSLPTVTRQVIVDIESGSSVASISEQLYQADVIAHPLLFQLLVRVHDEGEKLQAGEYQFDVGMSMQQVYEKILTGEVVLHYFRIGEGWTVKDVLKKLSEDSYLKHQCSQLSEKALAKTFQIPDDHPEGWFFPDTYTFRKDTSDCELLHRAYEHMQQFLKKAWQGRANDLPLKTAYQALIVASLVEKETALPSERNRVASVILRRLKLGMRLQIDPTVIYALGDKFEGNITRRDLKSGSPYNTYKHKGLPPTPIAIPSAASILASLHPENGRWLYFVAKGDGSHVFSTSLAAHNLAVKKYILKRSK